MSAQAIAGVLDLRTVARALHGDIVGRDQVSCPGPGHRLKDRSLSVWLLSTEPWIRVHSHAGDAWQECLDDVRARLGITSESRATRAPTTCRPPADQAPNDDDENRRRIVASIVGGIVPLRGSPGETYLRDVRKIDTDEIADVLETSDALGWHPSVLFRESGHALHSQRLGCIVGIMTDPITGKPTGGINRTYLREGRKLGKAT